MHVITWRRRNMSHVPASKDEGARGEGRKDEDVQDAGKVHADGIL